METDLHVSNAQPDTFIKISTFKKKGKYEEGYCFIEMFLHKIQIHTRETLGKRTVERESSTCNSEDKVSHLIHGEFTTTSFPVVEEKRSA